MAFNAPNNCVIFYARKKGKKKKIRKEIKYLNVTKY